MPQRNAHQPSSPSPPAAPSSSSLTLPSTGLSSNQGFLSVDNYGETASEVKLDLYDDRGTHVADVRVEIPAYRVEWFNSEHLEKGYPDRGLTSTPIGTAKGPTLWATLTPSRKRRHLRLLPHPGSDGGAHEPHREE